VYLFAGGLLLRESSLPTILEKNGKKRSPKAIAPTQTESDQAAYGTRKSKIYGAQLQIEAWDANAIIQSPLYCSSGPPMPKAWRNLGEFGSPDWLRKYMRDQVNGKHMHATEELWAQRKLEKAASSALAERAVHVNV